jgi:glucosamine-6-phosphate deaminase
VKTEILDTPEQTAQAAADAIVAAYRPGIVLALPTGRTPVPVYAELRRRLLLRAIDLTEARGFNLDELLVPRHDPRSFHSYMDRHVWGPGLLQRSHCDIPDGETADPEGECRRYEKAVVDAGGLDVAFLGVGADGHVAYNMPGPVALATHVTRLPDGLATALDIPPSEWPLRAITMGVGTIRSARQILVVATGGTKAEAVRALVSGPEDPRWPCSFLTAHPNLTLFLDHGAASRL